MQKKLSLILADTKRSFSYLNELISNKINIDNIVIYSDQKPSKLYSIAGNCKLKNKIYYINSNNINSNTVTKRVLKINSDLILFSGYSSEIIKNKQLFKKNLIHCHPGLLPKFKGSTMIYYSYILEKKIFVSVFKMTSKIDSGKVLYTKQFKPPKNLKNIESNFDDHIRAKAFVEFLLNNKKKRIKMRKSNNLTFYYISHPIIRNIVLNPKQILTKKI